MHVKLLNLIEKEYDRQKNTIDLIASENFTSQSVRKAVGSVFMHKYSEGYPGARFYEGNEFTDELEDLCRKMVLQVFGLSSDEWHANVQTLSGSTANLAVYNAILEPGDKILSMYLPDGGHLSHGWSYNLKNSKKPKAKVSEMVYMGGEKKVSIVSKIYNIVQYKTDPETNLFDYDFIEKLALKEKPKLIITGGTAYPRDINYERISEIAKKVGAYYHADVAHEAGLIAGKALSSPFKYADFVTFTTHKTLRGPRGAVAMCKKEFAEKLDASLFPGMQGGPFEHNIAGITQALFEADTDEFRDYASQVIVNAKTMANSLSERGFKVVTGGTDKHLVLVDLRNKEIGGKYLARALALASIISNKNTIPYETNSPVNPSGIRFGTASITTRGFKEDEVVILVDLIDRITTRAIKFKDLKFSEFEEKLKEDDEIRKIGKEVTDFCEKFPFN